MKLMELQLTDDEFADLIWRGKAGVHFTVNEETGMARYTEDFKDITKQGKDGLKWMIVNIRGESQAAKSFGKAIESVYFKYLSMIEPTAGTAPLPSFTQPDGLIKYGAQIASHAVAYTVKAITGAVDVDESWDQYVKDFMGIGGKEVIAEMQALYEQIQ